MPDQRQFLMTIDAWSATVSYDSWWLISDNFWWLMMPDQRQFLMTIDAWSATISYDSWCLISDNFWWLMMPDQLQILMTHDAWSATNSDDSWCLVSYKFWRLIMPDQRQFLMAIDVWSATNSDDSLYTTSNLWLSRFYLKQPLYQYLGWTLWTGTVAVSHCLLRRADQYAVLLRSAPRHVHQLRDSSTAADCLLLKDMHQLFPVIARACVGRYIQIAEII